MYAEAYPVLQVGRVPNMAMLLVRSTGEYRGTIRILWINSLLCTLCRTPELECYQLYQRPELPPPLSAIP